MQLLHSKYLLDGRHSLSSILLLYTSLLAGPERSSLFDRCLFPFSDEADIILPSLGT